MRILILSCNTGNGHNAAARAMEEKIKEKGHDATVLDIMQLSGERTSKLVGNAYINIAKNAPDFFHVLYQLGMVISSSKRKSPIYYINGRLAYKLKLYLEQNHYDAIIATHLYPAETLTYMKRKGMRLPQTIAIATDYTCIPFWEETDCDYYILPHSDLIKEYVNRGIDKDKLIPMGIPVKECFARKQNKVEVRKKLKLPVNLPIYLVMSGSMGYGRLQTFTSELLKQCQKGEQIVVICGNNHRIQNLLQKEFGNQKQVHILEYTKQVSDYMDACDVIFTKPGGLTSTEAAVKNIPIIHTRPIPGCESCNRDFFASRGMSMSDDKMKKQINEGRKLVQDEVARQEMVIAQEKNCNPDASEDILEFILSKIGG